MNLIIVGAGGHGRVCAEIASLIDEFSDVHFSDDGYEHGTVLGAWTVFLS